MAQGTEIERLYVVLGLDMKEFQDGMKKAGTEAKKGAGKLEGAFNSALPLIASGAAAAAAAVAAVGVAAFSAAADFEAAQNRISAMTGAQGQQLEELGEIARTVYKDNWGASIEEAAIATAKANQVLGQTGDVLEQSTKSALIFADVFGVEIDESLRAVRSGMDSFGITSQEVFDRMTAAIQRVGDPAGDLADTVNEYSIIFADAGFSADQMFGILESGVQAGARNFDVVADTLKEFIIRAREGGEEWERAVANILSGGGFQQIVDQLAATEDAVDRNADAIERMEGAYEGAQKVVKDLQSQLGEARRELDKLSRPNLAGMQEYEDQLFELEQRSKEAQLALLDLEPDTKAYEQAEKRLDDLNKEIDRVSLERDIEFEPQLRNIQRLAEEGTKEFVTYEQAIADIQNQKGVIEDLEQDLAAAEVATVKAWEAMQPYLHSQAILADELDRVNQKYQEGLAPAKQLREEFLAGVIGLPELFEILGGQLENVNDQQLRAISSFAVFGTQGEDQTARVISAMAEGMDQMQNFAGATEEAGNVIGSGVWAQFADIWRDILDALIPLGQVFLDVLQPILPLLPGYIQEFATASQPFIETIANQLVPAFAEAFAVIGRVFEGLSEVAFSLGLISEESSGLDTFFSILTFSIKILGEGIRFFLIPLELLQMGLGLLSDVIDTVLPKIEQLAGWVSSLAESTWEAVQSFWEMGSSLADLSIPDWLTPGSPTPLEMGIKGITKAINQVPDLTPTFGNVAQPAPVGSGAAGDSAAMGSTVNINIDGVNVSSAEGAGEDQAIEEVIKALRMAFRQKAQAA